MEEGDDADPHHFLQLGWEVNGVTEGVNGIFDAFDHKLLVLFPVEGERDGVTKVFVWFVRVQGREWYPIGVEGGSM